MTHYRAVLPAAQRRRLHTDSLQSRPGVLPLRESTWRQPDKRASYPTALDTAEPRKCIVAILDTATLLLER